jgi:hypothetical protein
VWEEERSELRDGPHPRRIALIDTVGVGNCLVGWEQEGFSCYAGGDESLLVR